MLTTLHRSQPPAVGSTVAERLVSRKGSWVALALGVLLAGGISAVLDAPAAPTSVTGVATSSESAAVDAQLAQLEDHDIEPLLLVATRRDGARLTPADLDAVMRLGSTMPTLAGRNVSAVVPSDDGAAAIVQLPVRVASASADNAATVDVVRDAVAAGLPAGLEIGVTGGLAFAADVTKAFDGANVALLLTTITIVALLLLLTYRSPVLWLVPLAVVGLADQVASVATAGLGQALDLRFDAGIVSVLVFGAGTNYALLLISRLREHLAHTQDYRMAVALAWRASLPAIVASNVTVVVSLASLSLAVIPSTRGLGVTTAVGLLVAAISVLGLLPAALTVCGPRVFWPFLPKLPVDVPARSSLWTRTASRVMQRPVPVVVAGLLLLGTMATGLLGGSVGLSQTERFRTPTESASALETLSAHFPAGMAQPMVVVAASGHGDEVARSIAAVPGVVTVRGQGRDVSGGSTGATGALTSSPVVLFVTTDARPGTAEAMMIVDHVRRAAHAVPGAQAMVGGAQATEKDARAGHDRDLRLLAPLVLGISGLVLMVLLRSILAPLLLLGINALSAVAALGAGSWIGRHLLGWPALDLQVPMLSLLFLVALGIDYTIFFVHRASTEAVVLGTRQGMIAAVSRTGAVITSAGVVLAAVFTALGVLPLVTLGQLGVIVALGVIVDTFMVRTVLVPAVFALVGERIWWPRACSTVDAQPSSRPEVI